MNLAFVANTSSILQWMGTTDKLPEMVRSFTLRDFTLVRRLSEQGVSLHSESALADDLHPLRGALLSMVVAGNFPTFVWKSEERDGTGFIQVLLEEDSHHAHILYLSPSVEPPDNAIEGTELVTRPTTSGDAWLSLIDQAVTEVGQHGVQSLVAEVSETGPELPILRHAGFAVYTRQDIWVLDEPAPILRAEADSSMCLRPYLSSDDWDIQLLYANTVPRLVQLVEPVPPSMTGDAWVLRDDGNELAAFVHVHEGSLATWLRFFIHPNAEADASEIVMAALRTKAVRENRSVYCCVRRYEGWLPAALEQTGFRIWGSQAVLVKHTVHHTRHGSPKLAVNLENAGMPMTTPLVRRYPIKENDGRVSSLQDGHSRQSPERRSTLISAN